VYPIFPFFLSFSFSLRDSLSRDQDLPLQILSFTSFSTIEHKELSRPHLFRGNDRSLPNISLYSPFPFSLQISPLTFMPLPCSLPGGAIPLVTEFYYPEESRSLISRSFLA